MNEELYLLELELREQELITALEECQRQGVSEHSLEVLIRESGARWNPSVAERI